MNGVLIAVAIIVAGNMLWGIYKGFFRVIYSMAAGILILVLTVGGTPYLAKWLTENTAIDTRIEQGCRERLEKLVENSLEDGNVKAEDGKNGSADEPTEQTELAKLKEKLPNTLLEQLLDPNELAENYLEKSGIYDELAFQASELAVKGISFLILLAVVAIVLGTLASALDLVAKLPVIKGVNRLLGLAAGLAKGVLWVWLAFAVIALGGATEMGVALIKQIYDSPVLVWIYENNILLMIIMRFL